VAAASKEAERADLHKTIWRIANDLHGSVDGWDLKTYVLGAGSPEFDYAALSDADAEFGRRETVVEKGFYILPSELFANVRANGRSGHGDPPADVALRGR
jgi:type I restriction enzyme M protein